MPAPYYVSVRGGPNGEFPNKPHATLEIATAEARRLHQLLKGEYLVRVMETTLDIDATQIRMKSGILQPRTVYQPVRNPEGETWEQIHAAKKLKKKSAPVIVVKRKKILQGAETEGA
jgi:hypothetical protein